MNWIELNNFSDEELAEARKQMHQAAQLPALAGRCLNPKDSADNYAALIYDKNSNWLTSQSLDESEFRIALSLSEFNLVITNKKRELLAFLALDSKTYDETFWWMTEKISELGLDSNKLNKNLPYQIPKYPTSKNVPFNHTNSTYFAELQKYFFNAAFVLEIISKNEKNISQVYCWPHHFDTAALITVERNSNPEKSKTIGVGLSPGDESYNEPYFYISPWPYPDHIENLPKLIHGHWHNQGWFGGVLTATEIIRNKNKSEQLKIAVNFIEAGIDKLKKLL
jgi:hypothetical protein